MTMYLQKNYNGTFAISVKNTIKDIVFRNYDYLVVVDNLPGKMTYKALCELVQKEFGCTKLVLDF